jgi:hypothetical protein
VSASSAKREGLFENREFSHTLKHPQWNLLAGTNLLKASFWITASAAVAQAPFSTGNPLTTFL